MPTPIRCYTHHCSRLLIHHVACCCIVVVVAHFYVFLAPIMEVSKVTNVKVGHPSASSSSSYAKGTTRKGEEEESMIVQEKCLTSEKRE